MERPGNGAGFTPPVWWTANTDVAGGGSYRKTRGERMRFKVLHKISDFKKQFGYQMCVGCGRCDDICPEYISFSDCLNRLADMEQEGE